VENSKEKETYKKRKNESMKKIYEALNKIHEKRFGTELGFKPSDLDCFE
jgi:RNA polymerase-binding transcription factor DksA